MTFKSLFNSFKWNLSRKFSFKLRFLIRRFLNFFSHFSLFIKYDLESLPNVGMFGNTIFLEASSICQLNCPICPTGQKKNKSGAVGWGFLSFNKFKNFIDLNPQIKIIELANWGEIFLNPELKDIIKYAYEKKVKLTARNGVNLNTVSDEVLESLVKFNFQLLAIALDGASNETYCQYRRGGNFENVIANIKKINYYKKLYNKTNPQLIWQFVIMGHNEHEILLAKNKAKELGMIFKPKLNWDPLYKPVKNKDFVKRESGYDVTNIEDFKRKFDEVNFFPCYQLWNSPQINWDGKLLGCCVNTYGDFGSVFESGLDNCLNSFKYVYAKKMLIGKAEARDDIPCSKCPEYLKVLKNPLKKKNIILYS